jgi:putative copper export protein
MTARLLCVWIHVLAAAAWVGSMVFFSTVIVPVLRERGAPMAGLLRRIGTRFRIFGLICLGTLLMTGIANLHFLGLTWSDLQRRAFWVTGFGHALAWKLGLVSLVLVATVVHDASSSGLLDALEQAPDAPATRAARRTAAWVGRLVALTSLAIVYFAVALVRGLPQ